MASRSRRGRPRGRAGGARPRDALFDPELASLPASDLIARLNRHRTRESEFVEVALVLDARERRLAEAEERIRATAEVADSLRDEVRAREAEIRALKRSAAEVEARAPLRAEVGGRDSPAMEGQAGHGRDQVEGLGGGLQLSLTEVDDDVPWPSPPQRVASPPAPELMEVETAVGVADVADFTCHEEDAPVEAEEGRDEETSMAVSGKRKELAAASEDNTAYEEGDTTVLCKFLAAESQPKSGDENHDAWVDVQALAILPPGQALPETPRDIRDAPEARTEHVVIIPEDGNMDMSTDRENEYVHHNVAAANDVFLGNDQLECSPEIGNDGQEKRNTQGVCEPEHEEPNTTVLQIEWGTGGYLEDGDEEIPAIQSVTKNPASQGNAVPASDRTLPNDGPEPGRVNQRAVGPHKKGMFYKMVFKALKEKERERAAENQAAAASPQQNYRCQLYAPLSWGSVDVEDTDPETPQK